MAITNNKLFLIFFACLLAASAAGCGSHKSSVPAVNTSSGGDGSGDSSGTGNTGNDNHTGTAVLKWQAPSTYTDGSPMTTLAGFKVYYGTSPRDYSNIVDVGDTLSFSLNDLATGTYYFSVTAYDADGNESDYSVEVSKTIT